MQSEHDEYLHMYMYWENVELVFLTWMIANINWLYVKAAL